MPSESSVTNALELPFSVDILEQSQWLNACQPAVLAAFIARLDYLDREYLAILLAGTGEARERLQTSATQQLLRKHYTEGGLTRQEENFLVILGANHATQLRLLDALVKRSV